VQYKLKDSSDKASFAMACKFEGFPVSALTLSLLFGVMELISV